MGDSVTNMEKCCFHYVRYIIASKFKSKSGSDYILLFFLYTMMCRIFNSFVSPFTSNSLCTNMRLRITMASYYNVPSLCIYYLQW